MKSSTSFLLFFFALSLSTFTHFSNAANCTSTPKNPKGDGGKLKNALQQATNTGMPLRITGTFYISSDIQVFLKKDLIVNASGAQFIATSNLDGDMFSFDSHNTKSNECSSSSAIANVEWKGGTFNMSNAKVSKVVPISSKTPNGREGTKNTADALSIRGVKPNNQNKLGDVLIEEITVRATSSDNDDLFEAGGDSGILLIGGTKATIINNAFYGIRDAAIYLSAGGSNGEFGDHFTVENNYIERAYDGITIKRGADNLKVLNNTLKDVVVGISTKNVVSGWTATNVNVSDNYIKKAVRAISIERANNATIENNDIVNLGAKVAGENKPLNSFDGPNQDTYEGISLSGVQGTNYVRYNSISGVSGNRKSSTTTYGVVTRDFDGRTTKAVNKSGNSFAHLDKWAKDY